ncbi:MAG: AhpC/TSA family protein [Acidobacteriota bacterium]
MADLAKARPALDAAGTPVAFVHMGTEEEADPWFARFGFADAVRVSDPTAAWYRAFGLPSGWGPLLAPRNWIRGTQCALVEGHGFGIQPLAALRQVPGVFLIEGRRILKEFRHRLPADRPDYFAFAPDR